MKKWLLPLFFVITLSTGCTGIKPSGGPYISGQPGQQQSRVIAYRTGGTLLKAEVPEVLLDGKPMGLLPDGGFLQDDVVAGKHSIQIRRTEKRIWRFNPVGINFVTQADETSFIELDLTSFSGGVITPWFGVVRSSVSVKQKDRFEAEQVLPTLTRVLITDR